MQAIMHVCLLEWVALAGITLVSVIIAHFVGKWAEQAFYESLDE